MWKKRKKARDSMIKDKRKGRRLVKSLNSGQVDRQAISYKRAKFFCAGKERHRRIEGANIRRIG